MAADYDILAGTLMSTSTAEAGMSISGLSIVIEPAPIRRPAGELMEWAPSPPAKQLELASALVPDIESRSFSALAGPEQASESPPTSPVAYSSAPSSRVESPISSHSLSFSEEQDTSTAVPDASPLSSSPYAEFDDVTLPETGLISLIQGLNRHELFEIVHPATLQEWDAVPGPKAVIFIANDTITCDTDDSDVHRHVVLIRKALLAIFPDVDPIIGSTQATLDVAHNSPVFPFLVHRIPESCASRLILQHCWTVDSFTFFALDFLLPSTSFVMTLVGLHLPVGPESNNLVETLVRHWLLNSDMISSFIHKHHDNLPSFTSIDEQVKFVIGTTEANGVTLEEDKGDCSTFNIYISPPTNDTLHHQRWLQELRAITFFSNCGTGREAPVFYCSVCKGRDHMSTSCSFPSNSPITVRLNSKAGPQVEDTHFQPERLSNGISINRFNIIYF
ncbi:hypothetical protein APHAL10511_007466 [Amanita phalloides]|nr:hypothetical protein APHAL10511_007466 [Amanita phalloides]